MGLAIPTLRTDTEPGSATTRPARASHSGATASPVSHASSLLSSVCNCPMNVGTSAIRALVRPAATIRQVPRRAAVDTTESSHVRHFYNTSFYPQGFTVNQDFGHLPVSRVHYSPKGLAGNVHLLRCLLLIKSLQVGQSDRLELIDGQCHFLELQYGYTPRFEVAAVGVPSDSSGTQRPGQFIHLYT